jgi:hypothetical protein
MKSILRIFIIFTLKMVRKFRGKTIIHPIDPHKHLTKSLEISRVIELYQPNTNKHFDVDEVRLDVLPSQLFPFKEAIFTPPILFNSPLRTTISFFNNAQIVGKNPIALTSSGDLIQEALFRTKDRNRPAITYITPNELGPLFWNLGRKSQIHKGQYCLLTSFWDNFGHWIPEHLLKIRSLIESDLDFSNVKFLIRFPIDGFKLDLLKAAGIKSTQLIEWNKKFMIVEELIVPTYPQISRENLDWINGLIPEIDNPTTNMARSIYLSRQNQNHRKIENELEIKQILMDFGFKTVVPENMSLQDQVNMIRQAKNIFGPQGSAFTLQIFMKPGIIIEAFPRDRIHLFNRQVAMIKGHKHFILTDSRGPDRTGISGPNLNINPQELRSLMQYVL